MCVDKLDIQSKVRNYSVVFEKNKDFIKSFIDDDNAIFIVDKIVLELYKNNILNGILNTKYIIVESKEEHKNIEFVCKLYKEIMKFNPRKNMRLVSIGGGIIQDITGFIASSLYRGVKWDFVPTTLLAQADSCIGAKTSLNFEQFKNLLGGFYPPHEIHIYTEFLHTLNQQDLYSGLGEVIKLHLLASNIAVEKCLEFIQTIILYGLDNVKMSDIIYFCLSIKQKYIEIDEFDSGIRNLLNLGHCFGHAIESASNFALPHGLAVALGIMMANHVATNRKLLNIEDKRIINEMLLKPLLIGRIPNINIDNVVLAMSKDKKNISNNGMLPLVMLINCNQNHKDEHGGWEVDAAYKCIKVNDLNIEEAKIAIKEILAIFD